MMKRGSYRWTVAVPVLLCLAAVVARAAEPQWLITPEEVARVTAGGTYDFKQLVAAEEGPGPQIVLKNPRALSRVVSPVDIHVKFEPGESGEPPDMGSLEVTLVGFIDIDITDRVREYVQGHDLGIQSAPLPKGRHRIRMAIKDVKGNPNERDVVVRVVDQ